MVYFAGKLIEKLVKSLAFESSFTSFSRVLSTSRAGYHAGKPIESVVYFLKERGKLHLKGACLAFWLIE